MFYIIAKKTYGSMYIVILSVLLFLALFVNYNYNIFFNKGGLAAVLTVILPLFFVLLYALSRFCLFTKTCDEKGLKRAQLVLWIIMGLVMCVLLITFYNFPVTDSYAIVETARWLAYHSDKVITIQNLFATKELGHYSNNYLFIVLLKYLYIVLNKLGLGNSYYPLYILNTLIQLFSNYLCFKLVKMISGPRKAVNALFLMTVSPTSYCFIFWIYSCILSIPLLLGSIIIGIQCCQTKNVKIKTALAGLLGLLFTLSYFIRPTSMFPVLAMACIAVLVLVKKGFKSVKPYAAGVVCFVLVAAFTFLTANKINDRYFGKVKYMNFPVAHWLMMGANGDGGFTKKDARYTMKFDTKEEKSKADMKKFLQYYKEAGVSGVAELYVRKMGITFSDGLSQADIRLGSDMKFTPMFRLLSGDLRYTFILYCQTVRILLLYLMLIGAFQLFRKPDISYIDIAVITLIGGVLFYCLWEAKSVYSLPFVPLMILCAVDADLGCGMVSGLVSNKTFLSLLVIFILTSQLVNYKYLAKDKVMHETYSIRLSDPSYCSKYKVDYQGKHVIEQDFYSKNDFNLLKFHAPAKKHGTYAVYKLEILDGDKVIRKKRVTARSVRKRDMYWKIERVAGQDSPFRLRISTLRAGSRYVTFRFKNGYYHDTYPGTNYVDGVRHDRDLAMGVMLREKYPFIKGKIYISICLAFDFLLAAVWYISYKSRSQCRDI